MYGGGPLAKEAGDKLASAGIPIYTMYGTCVSRNSCALLEFLSPFLPSSEYGIIGMMLPSKLQLELFASTNLISR